MGLTFLRGLSLAALVFIGSLKVYGVSVAFTGSFLVGKTPVNHGKNAQTARKHWSVSIAQMDRAAVS